MRARETADPGYDYERLLDLTVRIENCAHEVERGMPNRTPEGNAAALRLSLQVEEDAKELSRILVERQRAIEAGR